MIRRDGFVTGFSMALGAAVLALILIVGWRLVGAAASIATPFVVGTVIALLLNPVVTKVATRYFNGKRKWPVIIVFLGFLAVFIGLVAYLVPTVIGQTGRLIRFFAPLSYRIEQSVPGQAPKVLESDVAGTSYTVSGLENGTRYTFRVVAVDAQEREYRLRPVSAVPTAGQIVPASDKPAAEASPEEPATPAPASATPRPTPTGTASTVAAVRPTVEPGEVPKVPRPTGLPFGTPSPATTAVVPAAEPSPDASAPVPDFPSSEFGDTVPAEGAEDAEATPRDGTLPILAPETDAETAEETALPASATPRATPTAAPVVIASATPRAVPTPAPRATAPSPNPTPEPTATPQTVTGLLQRVGGRGQGGEQVQPPRGGAISLLDTAEPVSVKPGEIVATPGNGKVRLNWRAPANVQSGFDRLRGQLDGWLSEHRKIGPVTLPASFATLQTQYSEQATVWAQGFLRRAASTIIGSLGVLITVVLIPLVTFYVLSDIERLRGRLLFFLPERARIEFVRVTSDVGEVFGNYIRGMATVSAIYGVVNFVVFLGFGLAFRHGLAGYALLLGFIAGVLYPVPYIGPTATTGIAGIIALATGHSVGQTAAIVVTALVVNQLFDNVFVPRLVGKSVGLHPLITMLSLLLGANLFGLWGMLLSVPVAASIQIVLFRLIPRLGAPTPIAYLMPDKRPQQTSEGTTTASREDRDLLRTPDALTESKPSQSRADAHPDAGTDVTGAVPLGPVPTFRPPVADTSGKPPAPDAGKTPDGEK